MTGDEWNELTREEKVRWAANLIHDRLCFIDLWHDAEAHDDTAQKLTTELDQRFPATAAGTSSPPAGS